MIDEHPRRTQRRAFQRPRASDLDVVEYALTVPHRWKGRHGARLAGARVALRSVGPKAGPVVVVMGGISAHRIIADDQLGSRGWWRALCGVGRAIDTTRFRVFGIDYPHALGREEPLCPEDFADLLHRALARAGVTRVDALIGASFGGMVAQAYGRLFPGAVERQLIIAAGEAPHPMAQAWRSVQQQVLRLGLAHGASAEAVSIARQLAMTTYRSPEEFEERFSGESGRGELLGYLDAQGRRYADTVDPWRYLTLSASIDRHAERPEALTTPTTLVGFEGDQLSPPHQIRQMAARLPQARGCHILPSRYGHDGFLKEEAAMDGILRAFLEPCR